MTFVKPQDGMPMHAAEHPMATAAQSTATPCTSVAVIMPVRNEERYISRTLDQVLDQQTDGIELEIVVVDGQSTDRTREIVGQYAERHPRVRLLDNPRRLSSAARNVGIMNTTGEFIVIIDGHCEIPSRTYFQDMVAAFERSGADCLGRPQPLDVTNATPLQRAIAAARSSRLGHHPDSFIYSNEEVDCPAASVAVAYRRSVFEKVGLFDERFDACEDYELNVRCDQAGLKCRLVPKLTVKYEPRDSLRALFFQLYRYGRGRVRLARKHSRATSWSAILPAAFILGLTLGPLVCLAFPVLWPVYFGVVGTYLVVVLAVSFFQAWRNLELLLLIRLPAIFFAVHAGAGSGTTVETIARSLDVVGSLPWNR